MAMLLRCPMDHQWEVIPSDLFTATLYPLICPECGLDTNDPQGLATARIAIDSLRPPRRRSFRMLGFAPIWLRSPAMKC